MTKKQPTDAEIEEIVQDILVVMANYITNYTLTYAERRDLASLRRMQRRQHAVVRDLHPQPIMEWEVEDGDE